MSDSLTTWVTDAAGVVTVSTVAPVDAAVFGEAGHIDISLRPLQRDVYSMCPAVEPGSLRWTSVPNPNCREGATVCRSVSPGKDL